MSTPKLVAVLMIASVSASAVAASAQELQKPEQRVTATEFPAIPQPQPAGQEVADSTPSAAVALPEAPAPVVIPLSSYHAALAAPQQQGGPSSQGTYSNSNRRKYILIGVICAAAIVGGIIIAIQRD